ncbi:MAG: ABC transporter ATP-binding protein [Actinoplanes sp.]
MTHDEITGGGVLRRTLRRQIRRLSVGTALLCTHQTAEALVPVMIGVVIDRAVATSDTTALLLSIAGLAVLFTVLALAYRFGARQTFGAIEHDAHLVRVEIASRALDPRGHRSGLRDGELLSVTASDAELSVLVLRAVGVTAAALTAIGVSAVSLLIIDLWLGLGVLLAVPVMVFGLQRLAPLLTRRGEAQQEALAQTTALAVDYVTGLRVLRGIGAQGSAARRYAEASHRALTITLRAAYTKGLHLGLTTTVNGLFLAVVAGIAGWLAVQGRLSIGELVAVVGLAQFVAEPVQTLGYCVQVLAAARASAGRVARVLGARPMTTHGAGDLPEPAAERLTLDDIQYAGLDGIKLRLAAGEILGVLAYDPRDADALVTLLAGRVPRDDYRGTIRVDGVATDGLHLDAVRDAILVEQHDVALFEGTLRDNLAGRGDPGDGRLHKAVRAAAADDVLDAHPDGLDRELTERGANLSGGQRQRIGLARALAADPPVLVLHDPTTSVDAVTETLIAEGVAAARRAVPRGTLLITSSPALLSAADRVAVLDRGQVIAEGSHEDLVAGDERYRAAVLR